MKGITFALACFAVVIGTVGATFGFIEQGRIDHQARQIAHLNSSLTRAQAALSGQAAKLARQDARLRGASADVITCADVQNMSLSQYWQDSDYTLQSDPVPLPAHCINR